MAKKWAWTEVVQETCHEVEGVRSLARLRSNQVQPFTNAPSGQPHQLITNGARVAHGDGSYMYASEAARGHVSRQGHEREGQGMAGGGPVLARRPSNAPHVVHDVVHKTLHDPPAKKFVRPPGAQLAHLEDIPPWGSELAVQPSASASANKDENLSVKGSVKVSSPAQQQARISHLNWVGNQARHRMPNYSWKRDRAEVKLLS
jgi:hypothetical protein